MKDQRRTALRSMFYIPFLVCRVRRMSLQYLVSQNTEEMSRFKVSKEISSIIFLKLSERETYNPALDARYSPSGQDLFFVCEPMKDVRI